MSKKYETPEVKIIAFEVEDVITLSGIGDLGHITGDEGVEIG